MHRAPPLLALLVAFASCGRTRAAPTLSSKAPSPTQDVAVAPTPIDQPPPLPPLHAEWLERFDLPGGQTAMVSMPQGATERRPVMIAVHGGGDRPDWACGEWRGVTNAYPFIVCPQGSPPGSDRFAWGSTAQIQKIIDLALPALRARFSDYMAEGPMLYAGFYAGVIYGAGVVRANPSI